MSIQFIKPLDSCSIRQKVTDTIARYKLELDLIHKLLWVLKEYKGKPISKHITNKFNKLYPEYKTHLNQLYGMYHIDIAKETPFKNETIIHALIGYHSGSNIVNMEEINKHVKCYTLNDERIPKLQMVLEGTTLKDLVNEWNGSMEQLQEINEKAKQYELEYTFDLEVRNN